MIVSEIKNQTSIASQFICKVFHTVKTPKNYYIFLELCNGGDLKVLMEAKDWKLSPNVIRKIMYQLTHGVNDMMQSLIIHRDLKLKNVMLNFPGESKPISIMEHDEKMQFLSKVDLENTPFEIKIADFGFSKQLNK